MQVFLTVKEPIEDFNIIIEHDQKEGYGNYIYTLEISESSAYRLLEQLTSRLQELQNARNPDWQLLATGGANDL